MESSVIAAIISVLGAGLLGMFGYFMQRLHTDIRNLGVQINTRIDKLEERINTRIDKLETRIDTRIDKLETRIDKLEEKVDNLAVEFAAMAATQAAMAATQAEHGISLQHVMGHGERISTLEGAAFGAGI